MAETLYCNACKRRSVVQPPLCARVCSPTPEEQAQTAKWRAALRCKLCGSAEVGPFRQRQHDPENWKRVSFLGRLCEDNVSSYRADLARAQRAAAAPESLRCPRCGEKVTEMPTAERLCWQCGGY